MGALVTATRTGHVQLDSELLEQWRQLQREMITFIHEMGFLSVTEADDFFLRFPQDSDELSNALYKIQTRYGSQPWRIQVECNKHSVASRDAQELTTWRSEIKQRLNSWNIVGNTLPQTIVSNYKFARQKEVRTSESCFELSSYLFIFKERAVPASI